MSGRTIKVSTGQIPAPVLKALMGNKRYKNYARAGQMTCRHCGAVVYGWRALTEHIVNTPDEQHMSCQRWAKNYLAGRLPGYLHFPRLNGRINDLAERIDRL